MGGSDDELLARVAEAIDDGKGLQFPIAGGRVHIERQLPFLLLHRRPPAAADVATADLVVSEASYAIATDDEGTRPALDQLIATIAAAQRARFGSFLLLELWASPTARADEGVMVFRIHAPAHGAPGAVLEELESALLGVEVDDLVARVEIVYADDWAPAGLLPLGISRDEVVGLGLEVPAVHFEPDTGTVLPFELRQLRQRLGRALRRAFYEFTHACTSTRPAHYQELGPQAVTERAFDVDRQLGELSDEFDLLLHVTPVNGPAAEREFLSGGARRAPEFLYRPRTIDPDMMKRRLYAVPIEQVDDPTLAHVFSEKRDELDRQLTLVSDRNTPRFLLGSRSLHGDPGPALLDLAERLLGALEPGHAGAEAGPEGPQMLADAARAEFERYRSLDPTLGSVVEIRDDIPGVMVSAGNLLIGSRARVPEHRIEPLIAHEVGTHVLTYHNGHRQPFRELQAGMAGYESLQEGLGVLSEFLVGGLDQHRLRQLAGRVVAAQSIIDGADFVETFTLLRDRWGFDQTRAFELGLRIYRGGGFIKDVVYLRGLAQLLEYLAADQPIERLYLGKLAHDHLQMIEELEHRRILAPPQLLPRHLDRPDVVERLDRCREGLSILDLAREVAA